MRLIARIFRRGGAEFTFRIYQPRSEYSFISLCYMHRLRTFSLLLSLLPADMSTTHRNSSHRCVSLAHQPRTCSPPLSGVARHHDESDRRSYSNILKIIVIVVATSSANALTVSNWTRRGDFLSTEVVASKDPNYRSTWESPIDAARAADNSVFSSARRGNVSHAQTGRHRYYYTIITRAIIK